MELIRSDRTTRRQQIRTSCKVNEVRIDHGDIRSILQEAHVKLQFGRRDDIVRIQELDEIALP